MEVSSDDEGGGEGDERSEDAFEKGREEEVRVKEGVPDAAFLVEDGSQSVERVLVLSVLGLSALDDEAGADEVERGDGDGCDSVRKGREEEKGDWSRGVDEGKRGERSGKEGDGEGGEEEGLDGGRDTVQNAGCELTCGKNMSECTRTKEGRTHPSTNSPTLLPSIVRPL